MKRAFSRRPALLLILSITLSLAALAQEKQQKPAIDWQEGPITAKLGDSAEIQVPEGFLFTDKKGAQKLLELTENIPNGTEVGAIVPKKKQGEELWFVTFEFQEVGFVKDDEKDKLDEKALLKSIQDATEEGNKIRAGKGWPAFHVAGWEHLPYYDQSTNNLTWAIRGNDDKGESTINHSIRVLGRQGTMNVDVVMSPEQYSKVVPQFNQLVSGLKYRQGHRYTDYVSGDKVAEYGLAALIAGGAGALAVKTGLLLKMWKFIVAIFAAAWKLIVAAFVAGMAWLKRMWKRLTGRQKEEDERAAQNLPPSL